MKYLIWPVMILLIFVRYFTTGPIYKDGDTVRISSTLYSDPITYSNSLYLKLADLKVYLPRTEISYGDKVTVEGIVNGDKLDNPKLINVERGQNVLSKFRNNIVNFYQNNLPQPESGLLAGIVLGSKNSLSQDFYEKTKLTGVAHVVVASGTNVTFVISFLLGILTIYLPRRKAIPFVILGIILYLFMAGFDAPLIRAAIMSGALFLGQETGRLASAWRIFILSALIMLLTNPFWIKDVGFLLSFATTGSLLAFEKRIKLYLHHVPGIIREDLSTSLAAQIGAAPILFVTFGQFNIWSPVVNVLILWTVAPLMIIGALGGVVGLFLPTIGKLILWLGYPMLWWFVKIVDLF